MENKAQDEIQRRKKVFRDFLGCKPSTKVEGMKREAVEKVFFFSESQFNEVCEDLLEEIQRRNAQVAAPLEFIPHYSLKRNTIREQMSLLESADMRSLVEDAFLVLSHKHPDSPEDRLECLNVLVGGLQEIVASNIPQDSPASIMKSIENARRQIEVEKDPLVKMEFFLDTLSETSYDTSQSTQELFSMMRQSIKEEKKRMQYTATVSAELLAALELLCTQKGRADYLETMKKHDEINDHALKNHHRTNTTIQEFLQISKSLTDRESLQKEKKALAAQKAAESSESITTVVEQIIQTFGEIEFCIEKSLDLKSLQKSTARLFQHKPLLVKVFQKADKSSRDIESLPVNANITSEQEAITIAKRYYSAISQALS
ncbi:hypothetical protein NEHOM01_2256 [Nematocida homosporus]|uniref:uncharacterized protein n=1 Tax=Nematocida homosporus TaxID=1912981 RepID=UPI00221F6615|nr:uncharacterized protein NEHOM01_2256 [Nematocida homosporus]KAI5187541.1 hypothetical protein NEHOM01_2256 [Nematocida homosporus]